jgi:hypothetical protein
MILKPEVKSMAQPQVIEGTGKELQRYLKQQPEQRFRLTRLSEEERKPFHETATPEEWMKAFREWAESHKRNSKPLPDEAISRDSIYEGRG